MVRLYLVVVVAAFLGDARCARGQTQDDFETITPRVKWRFEVGGCAGPITVEKSGIFVGCSGPLGGGSMHCFTRSGSHVWRADHPKLPLRANDMGIGIHSKPAIKDDRVYYNSNRGEIICADLEGFFDGENDGPYQEETSVGRPYVDIVWKVDLMRDYGVYKRDAGDIYNPHPSVLLDGDALYCIAGHGRKYEEGPNGKWFENTPDAPSLVALDSASGALRWKHHADNHRIRIGQWGSPSFFDSAAGEQRLAYSGGDAILYSLDPKTGKVHWQTELEPAHGKGFSSGHPCVWEDLLLVGLGRECDDTIKFSIFAVTREGAIAWRFAHPELHGCISSLVVRDGVAFAYSSGHVLFALDARTGALHEHRKTAETAALFYSPVLVKDRILVASDEGVYEFTADKLLTPKRYWDCGYPQSDPVVVGNEIFVVNSRELICAKWEEAK